jgi:tripartite-type tricarboxylate transporter receptor subunit TctC
MTMHSRIAAAVVTVVVGFAWSASAADSAADFYKGKQIRLVVGSAPGGAYDQYSRLVSRHLSRLLPGNPAVIVQNQPGAGSINALNDGYASLPQDGTVIIAPQGGPLFEQILGNQAARYDTSKYQWLGSLNEEAGVGLTWYTSKVKTFGDLMKYDSVFGTSGPNVTEQGSSILINMFGAKIKQVPGYESVVAIHTAMERGEVEGMTTVWASLNVVVPHWMGENKLNLLVQFALHKQQDLPESVPLVMDLLTEQYLKPEFKPAEARLIWQFILAQQAMARPYGMGPDVPKDRIDVMRKAFSDMAKDKDFLADAKQIKREISFLDGVAVQKLVADAAATPKPTLERVSEVSRLVRK